MQVEAGDRVQVTTIVERLGEKGPVYQVHIRHMRNEKQTTDLKEEYTQKDVFPWLKR